MISKKIINDLSDNPYNVGNSLSLKKLEEILIEASKAYYNKTEFINDYTFDILKEILESKDPKNPFLKEIGAPILQSDKKVKLPIWMGSMDKVKPNSSDINRWLEKYKNNFTVSDKLDGLSGLLELKIENNDLIYNLYSRGNGEYGQNINKLLPYINLGKLKKDLIKEKIKKNNNRLLLRGEIIIKKKVFEKNYKLHYPKARSFVAGIVNSKQINKDFVTKLDFVIYELVDPWTNFIEQFKIIKILGFNLVNYCNYDKLNTTILKRTLLDFKLKSEYEIDGIIISSNIQESRNISGNPKYSVAFKMLLDEQIETTEVEYVEYNVSKHGLLIPRVRFKPIKIGGDTIMYATGFNLKFIIDNKIGKGALIEIVRSGDVIPYIYKIIKSSTQPDLPNVEWKWNQTKIHGTVTHINDNPDVIFKRILNFFKVLEIEGLGPGIIKKFLESGYDSIDKIMKLTPTQIASIDGFQIKSGINIVNNIKKVTGKPIKLNKLMASSNIFGNGLGEKKLKPLIDNYPNIINMHNSNKLLLDDIIKINGFSEKTANQFMSGLPLFINWMKIHSNLKIDTPLKKGSNNITVTNKPLLGRVIVFTGFRDKNLEGIIEDKGGVISSQVSSKTDLLIVKDLSSVSSKVSKARELNINIIDLQTAKQQFL